MNESESTLIADTIRSIIPADALWRNKAKERINTLTMPPWALGRLLDLAVDLAGITRSLAPKIERRAVVIMAGDHGVATEGVSAYPPEVTAQMIHNFARGGAGVNILAEQAKARVIVVDMGVAGNLDSLVRQGAVVSRKIANGTRNILNGPAMPREQAIQSIETGIKIAAEYANSIDLFATGEMGIGNTTPSSAIVSVLCGVAPLLITGCGTGISGTTRLRKAEIIAHAIEINRPDPNDPIDVLAKVGGFEIGALAGLILGAAATQKPVLVDGLISTSAALLAQRLCPASASYMIASHQSVELGHQVALTRLGKRPLLNLELRLGEGTGAVLAMHLVDAAVGILTRMATFEEAGVSSEKR
jgi:nicotinate-nucleotide--dimethylbenzimidazole phosphoribosyltransferase